MVGIKVGGDDLVNPRHHAAAVHVERPSPFDRIIQGELVSPGFQSPVTQHDIMGQGRLGSGQGMFGYTRDDAAEAGECDVHMSINPKVLQLCTCSQNQPHRRDGWKDSPDTRRGNRNQNAE